MIYPYLGSSVPMQKSFRSFDGIDPPYSTEDIQTVSQQTW